MTTCNSGSGWELGDSGCQQPFNNINTPKIKGSKPSMRIPLPTTVSDGKGVIAAAINAAVKLAAVELRGKLFPSVSLSTASFSLTHSLPVLQRRRRHLKPRRRDSRTVVAEASVVGENSGGFGNGEDEGKPEGNGDDSFEDGGGDGVLHFDGGDEEASFFL
ncbi:hypothetical protein PIB30_090713 [Stylosanthes scabra]|uniref:Uncharacterized protein n=1 Tax=Stylosanthes scabra TaxID=79078 RepID=A0ABU6ZT16_9FABA|nr:hypothetical protein [Stylosanthes scabra]